ncbi:MAG TPA: hypothetical protein VIM48_02105 [Chthoniobacterales bacterium]
MKLTDDTGWIAPITNFLYVLLFLAIILPSIIVEALREVKYRAVVQKGYETLEAPLGR